MHWNARPQAGVVSHECHSLTACWHGLPLPVAPTPSPHPPIRLEQQPEAGENPAPSNIMCVPSASLPRRVSQSTRE